MRMLLEHLNRVSMGVKTRKALLQLIDLLLLNNLTVKDIKHYCKEMYEDPNPMLNALSWLTVNGYVQTETFKDETRYYLLKECL